MFRKSIVIGGLLTFYATAPVGAGLPVRGDNDIHALRLRIAEARSLVFAPERGNEGQVPSTPVFGTAGDWYSLALDCAHIWASDVIPVAMFNTDTLTTEGTSRGWGYSFFSESFDSVLYIQISDAEFEFGHPQPPHFTDPISGAWVDTDEVIPLADTNGGTIYRSSNTGVLVQAFLSGENYDPCVLPSYYWTVGYTSESASELDFFVKGSQPVLFGYYTDCSGLPLVAEAACDTALARALQWASDAELFSVESLGAVDAAGLSPGWAFEFLSLTRNATRRYHTCGETVSSDMHTGTLRGRIPEPLPGGWQGSGEAAVVGDSQGGSDFMGQHPLASRSLTLTKSSAWPFNEHLWQVTYSDIWGEVYLALVSASDAVFRGAFLSDRNLDSLTTSDAFRPDAVSAALGWKGDAYLYGIVSTSPLSFAEKGASPAWAYLFHSPVEGASISVVVQSNGEEPVIGMAPFSNPSQPGDLAAGWIESDSAAAVSARAGGGGVGGGALIPVIEANLCRGLFEAAPERLVWAFVYSTPCHTGTFYVDAYTGEVLDGDVGVEEDCAPPAPRTALLFQNYPNPFNPQTFVRYDIADPGPVMVKLSIHDLHGRRVKSLVERVEEAGPKSVVWDGRNERGERVSSGVYFMRLEAGSEHFVRKMLLLR